MEVDRMGSDTALCVAPGGDDFDSALAPVYDLVYYVLTELSNNVRQHSGGGGFATAQVRPSKKLVQLAIADNGKGFRRSFIDAGFSWAAELDDVAAIKKAIEPFISSKGNPTNEGVGLTLTTELARRAGALLLIASGTGALVLGKDHEWTSRLLPNNSAFEGTLVAMTFYQEKVPDFALMLQGAKEELGLLQRKPGKGRFTA